MAEDNYTYPLHENVFFGNIVKLNALVESEAHDIAQKDKHGEMINQLSSFVTL